MDGCILVTTHDVTQVASKHEAGPQYEESADLSQAVTVGHDATPLYAVVAWSCLESYLDVLQFVVCGVWGMVLLIDR